MILERYFNLEGLLFSDSDFYLHYLQTLHWLNENIKTENVEMEKMYNQN